MMPTIRIDDDVWSWLKDQARPFEDTPNSVLRRVAGLDGPVTELSSAQPRLRRITEREYGRKLPQGEYRNPILSILLAHGGRADRSTVLRELEKVLGSRLTAFDRRDIKSGTVRWEKTAEWEVNIMRRRGLLLSVDQSPRGVWCLSEEGKRLARSLNSERRGA